MSKDDEVRSVTAQLAEETVRLKASVDALVAILNRPLPPQEAEERLLPQ